MKQLLFAFLFLGFASTLNAQESRIIRIGIIGLDTSHVPAFTKIFNTAKEGDLAGFRVVAGYPGGSPDFPASKDRVEKFTATLRDTYQVEIVSSIEELLKKVDVVLLESVDGRPHLEQVTPVLKAGKKVFIDKPVAASLADAIAIVELSRQTKTPFFSTSSIRFYPGVQNARKNAKIGDILGCLTYGPCAYAPHHPDLFWYGIHGIEPLFTLMGTGCQSVTRIHNQDFDLVTGVWNDGRIGTYRGNRKGASAMGGTVFGSKGIQPLEPSGGYDGLVVEIAKFFKTGVIPVPHEETLEVVAFMEAAEESKRQNGAAVTLESMFQKAREVNAARKK